MMSSVVSEMLKGYENLGLSSQVELLEEDLKLGNVAFEERISRHGRRTKYYVGEDVVTALITFKSKKTGEAIFPTLLDKFYYEKYLENGSHSLCMSVRNDNKYKVVVNGTGKKSMPALHREILREAGKLVKGQVVDHKFGSVWINVEASLRACSGVENRHNSRFYFNSAKGGLPASVQKLVKKGYSENKIYSTLVAHEREHFGEYAYNPLYDYTKTWYAYFLYRMTDLISDQDLLEYQKNYIMQYDEQAARYYKSILEEV